MLLLPRQYGYHTSWYLSRWCHLSPLSETKATCQLSTTLITVRTQGCKKMDTFKINFILIRPWHWTCGSVDLKTYWPPKKLTGPYLKTKLARRKTICINLQFAHRPIIKLFRSHPRNIFQIWMVILKKNKKIYWPGGPVENQLLWPELARPPKKCVRASGHIANVKPCLLWF